MVGHCFAQMVATTFERSFLRYNDVLVFACVDFHNYIFYKMKYFLVTLLATIINAFALFLFCEFSVRNPDSGFNYLGLFGVVFLFYNANKNLVKTLLKIIFRKN